MHDDDVTPPPAPIKSLLDQAILCLERNLTCGEPDIEVAAASSIINVVAHGLTAHHPDDEWAEEMSVFDED